MQGLISNIERYAINDGFGLRTTVFFKGCPLRCRWCCNPETQKTYPEMVFFPDKCIRCGACVTACPHRAIGSDLQADRDLCDVCYQSSTPFACTLPCYAQCRKQSGIEMTAEEVAQAVERDRAFYRRSGGGVTLSGGEPLSQGEFAYQLCRLFKQMLIDTAIETCGAANGEDYRRIAPFLSFAFFDLKHTDCAKHRLWTGGGNQSILENAVLLDELAQEHGFDLIYRIPVIPGFNDTPEEIREICRFVKKRMRAYRGVELLPYHKLGRGKYHSLGLSYPMGDTPVPGGEEMAVLQRILQDNGITRYEF